MKTRLLIILVSITIISFVIVDVYAFDYVEDCKIIERSELPQIINKFREKNIESSEEFQHLLDGKPFYDPPNVYDMLGLDSCIPDEKLYLRYQLVNGLEWIDVRFTVEPLEILDMTITERNRSSWDGHLGQCGDNDDLYNRLNIRGEWVCVYRESIDPLFARGYLVFDPLYPAGYVTPGIRPE